MREEFSAIVNGWDLISGFNAITDRIEEIAKWQKENGPLQEDEEKDCRINDSMPNCKRL